MEDYEALIPEDQENNPNDDGRHDENQERAFNESVWDRSSSEVFVTHLREYFKKINIVADAKKVGIRKYIFQWILVILK